MAKTIFTIFFSVIFLLEMATCLSTDKAACHRALTRDYNERGVNRLSRGSSQPVFELKFIPQSNQSVGHDGLETYRVQIQVENVLLAFSDAKIVVEGEGKCGGGSLTYQPQDFFERYNSQSCPTSLATDRGHPMMELPPLLWKPPTCGCVTFRAVVIEGGRVYYSDKPSDTNGHLTKTICVQEKGTRAQYLQALCAVRERYSSAEILSRPSFMTRHALDATWMDRRAVELALELRNSDNRECCNKPSEEERHFCFEIAQRRRVDRFCEDGYPDIAFTTLRLKHMRVKEKQCCFILGGHRYSCFQSESHFAASKHVPLLEYSMDETDPANDLVEFATLEDFDILKLLRTVTIGAKTHVEDEDEVKDEDEDEDEDEEDDDSEDESDEDEDEDDVDEEKISNGQKDLETKPPIKQTETNTGNDHQKKKHKMARTQSESGMVKSPPTSLGETEAVVDVAATHKAGLSENERNVVSQEISHKKTREPGKKRRKQPEKERGSSKDAPTRTSSEKRKTTVKQDVMNQRPVSREIPSREAPSGRRDLTSGGTISPRQSLTSAEKRQIAAKEAAPTRDVTDELVRQVLPRYSSQALASVQELSREAGKVTNRYLSTERRLIRESAERDVDYKDFENYDDEGGISLEETLLNLKRKMEKLKIKKQCCEHGAIIGSHVIGSFIHAWKECRHSSEKYLSSVERQHGNKACHEQFKKCCLERALSGPAMTSSEYRDKADMYLHNPVNTEVDGEEKDILERRTPIQEGEDEMGDAITDSLQTGRFSQEAILDRESERRYQTMRATSPERGNLEEEEDGPKRFDEVDNGDDLGVLNRQGKALRKRKPKQKYSKADEEKEMTDFDDRSFTDNPEFEDDDVDEDRPGRDEMSRMASALTRPNRRQLSREIPQRSSRRSHHEFDILDRMSLDLKEPAAARHDVLSKGYRRNSRSSRKSRGRTSRRRSRPRNSRRRNSRKRSSRRSSRERLYGLPQSRYVHADFNPLNQVRALDSQEMAATHDKRYIKTLDSKEMNEAHKRAFKTRDEVPQSDMRRFYYPRRRYRTG